MPTKSKRPCSYPGCPELTNEYYCETHQKKIDKEYNKRRGSAASQGYDARWRKARKLFLNRNPLCNVCKRVATVVDHIKPHKGDKVLFWDMSNWQAMCKSCHDTKTAKEDGRWGKIISKG